MNQKNKKKTKQNKTKKSKTWKRVNMRDETILGKNQKINYPPPKKKNRMFLAKEYYPFPFPLSFLIAKINYN